MPGASCGAAALDDSWLASLHPNNIKKGTASSAAACLDRTRDMEGDIEKLPVFVRRQPILSQAEIRGLMPRFGEFR